MEVTFEISHFHDAMGGHQAIKCLVCGRTSHNATDVRERYCGNCHEFHDDRALRKAMVKQGHMKEI